MRGSESDSDNILANAAGPHRADSLLLASRRTGRGALMREKTFDGSEVTALVRTARDSG